MEEENKPLEQIINTLENNYTLQSDHEIKPNLSFPVLNQGEFFKLLFTWKIGNFKSNTLLCSIINSYEVDGINTYTYFSKTKVIEEYLILYIESEKSIPDFIIRPAYFVDRLGNFFLRFDRKIKNRKVFNKNFIVESSDNKRLLTILKDPLIDEIKLEKNLYIEANEGRILIKYEQKQDLKIAERLLKIGEKFDQILTQTTL